MKELINSTNIITVEKKAAQELHYQILFNGELAATALVDFCKGLKKMRDEKLYLELNFESFEEYVETAVGMKQRQAYTYISSLEKLGADTLQKTSNLGITKLELLAVVPVYEREEVIENNDLAGMTTKEVKELVDKYAKQGEQLAMVIKEKEELTETTISLKGEINELDEQVENLSNKPTEVAVQEPSQADIEKIKADLKKELEADQKSKNKDLIDKEVKKQVDKAASDAAAKAKADAEASLQTKISELERKNTSADEKATALEKQLKLSDSTSTTAKIYFGEMKDNYNKLIEIVEKMDEEGKVKFTGAIKQALKMFLDNIG